MLFALGPADGWAQTRPLRWGADAEGGAPYIFKDPKNPSENIGFEVDLVQALARELGRPIEFQQYEFDSLVQGLDRGDLDFAMNGLERTPDRAQRVRFSKPYYVYRLQLVTRAGETRFQDLDELKRIGGIVATLGDTAASRLLDEKQIVSQIYNGQAEPYQDLELGRVDAVLMDSPIAVYYARPNTRLQFAGQPFAEGYYAIAFPKSGAAESDLPDQVDAALARLIAGGEVRRITEKWGIWSQDQERLVTGEGVQDVLAESARSWSFARYFPMLFWAALVTIEISVASMALAMAIGLVVAIARLYGPWPLRLAATLYVEFFRGIPALLLLNVLYFGIPHLLRAIDVQFAPPSFFVAILAFGLNYAAFEAEIYRAGLSSIPVGQWEAAASLGMAPVATFRRIILPQAMRVILPPVTNDFVALFKDTSLVSTIALVELTKQSLILSKSSLKYFEIGMVTALLYLLMSVPLGYLARYLEHRWGKAVL